MQLVDGDGRVDGVALTIPPGTVILPREFVLLVRNDVEFRATYGGGKFVAAEYTGSLRDTGESVALRNPFGAVISSVTYDIAMPWPAGPAGGGTSLELVDTGQGAERVANWAASAAPGGTPGAPNSMAGFIPSLPDVFVNEVLADNTATNRDVAGDYDEWVELYNASSQPIDLAGTYLTNDLGTPTMWPLPADTTLCGGCWLLIWLDNEPSEGPLHATFTADTPDGVVALLRRLLESGSAIQVEVTAW